MDRVVIDTNIFISALMNKNGAPRHVLRLALQGGIQPVMGNALLWEYEDVLSREKLFKNGLMSQADRAQLFHAILSVSSWVPVYFLWRPNLRDEADNHLIELAIAGNANVIITANKRDFRHGELLFPDLKIYTAGEYLDHRKLHRSLQ